MDGFALPGASVAYRQKRQQLLEAEIALRDQREKVAELRRGLDDAGDMPAVDYTFSEYVDGAVRDIPMADLFGDKDTLAVVHYMWNPKDEKPCPMCSLCADGYAISQRHIRQRTAFVVAAKQKADIFARFAEGRGWGDLRIVSTGGTSFNTDFGMEEADGSQRPGVSIFTKNQDGTVRHFYTGGAVMGPDQYRGMDLLMPVWNFFDLLPQGRGDFFPQLSYS